MMNKRRGRPHKSEEFGVPSEDTKNETDEQHRRRERGMEGGETTGQTQPVCVSTSLHSHEKDKSERRERAGQMENN